jgi:hypothetical protein
MSVQPTDDTDEMCRRIMYVLLHEINLQPQTIEFNKDLLWEAASSIPGVFKEYGLGLKERFRFKGYGIPSVSTTARYRRLRREGTYY